MESEVPGLSSGCALGVLRREGGMLPPRATVKGKRRSWAGPRNLSM